MQPEILHALNRGDRGRPQRGQRSPPKVANHLVLFCLRLAANLHQLLFGEAQLGDRLHVLLDKASRGGQLAGSVAQAKILHPGKGGVPVVLRRAGRTARASTRPANGLLDLVVGDQVRQAAKENIHRLQRLVDRVQQGKVSLKDVPAALQQPAFGLQGGVHESGVGARKVHPRLQLRFSNHEIGPAGKLLGFDELQLRVEGRRLALDPLRRRLLDAEDGTPLVFQALHRPLSQLVGAVDAQRNHAVPGNPKLVHEVVESAGAVGKVQLFDPPGKVQVAQQFLHGVGHGVAERRPRLVADAADVGVLQGLNNGELDAFGDVLLIEVRPDPVHRNGQALPHLQTDRDAQPLQLAAKSG